MASVGMYKCTMRIWGLCLQQGAGATCRSTGQGYTS